MVCWSALGVWWLCRSSSVPCTRWVSCPGHHQLLGRVDCKCPTGLRASAASGATTRCWNETRPPMWRALSVDLCIILMRPLNVSFVQLMASPVMFLHTAGGETPCRWSELQRRVSLKVVPPPPPPGGGPLLRPTLPTVSGCGCFLSCLIWLQIKCRDDHVLFETAALLLFLELLTWCFL